MRALSPLSPRLLVALLAVGVLSAACGSDVDAVSVAGESLSRSDLDEALDDLAVVPGADPAAEDDGEDRDDDANQSMELAGNFLTNFILAQAFGDELAERGYGVGDEELRLAAEDLEAQNPPFAIDSVAGETFTRLGAVQAMFEQWIQDTIPEVDLGLDPDDFYIAPVTPEYMCSSHILLETIEDAFAVVDRLDDGEDFAELAMEVSTGPSGPGGGDLDCVDTSTFIVEFVDGARLVAPAGVTGPVETEFGWHIIELRSLGTLSTEVHPEMDSDRVQSILDAAEASARAAAEQQVAALEDSAAQEQQRPLIEELRSAVADRIERDLDLDARYGEWSTDDFVVLPPSGVSAG